MAEKFFKPDREFMRGILAPWQAALANPPKAQEEVLQGLLANYSQTEYGRQRGAEKVSSYEDYKKSFPVRTYEQYKPLLEQVLQGHPRLLLYEDPVCWKLTKGTTGENKFFPFLPSQIAFNTITRQRILYAFALAQNDLDWLSGYRLSLSSTADLGTLRMGDREMRYGYSIAVAMGFVDQAVGLPNRIVPTQQELNTIVGESSREIWEQRYELAYQKAHAKPVTHVWTSHNVLLGFARYLRETYGVVPKDLWDVRFLLTASFPGVNTRFAAPIKRAWGKSAEIRDLYASTEGYFGGQIDEKKAWVPFYDYQFFEVQTINGIKQLHEMKPGEIGAMIVSTDYLPRYRNGDLILAFEAPYFRCIGRENAPMQPYRFGKL